MEPIMPDLPSHLVPLPPGDVFQGNGAGPGGSSVVSRLLSLLIPDRFLLSGSFRHTANVHDFEYAAAGLTSPEAKALPFAGTETGRFIADYRFRQSLYLGGRSYQRRLAVRVTHWMPTALRRVAIATVLAALWPHAFGVSRVYYLAVRVFGVRCYSYRRTRGENRQVADL